MCPPSALLCRVSRSLTLTRLAVDTDDKEQNDRLIQAAVTFCEQHAKTYKVPEASGGNAADPWQLVPGQAVNYKFVASGEASADGKRPFGVKVGWLDTFEPGCTLRFPTVPGLANGFQFKLPSSADVRGKTMAVQTVVDTAAVKKDSFTVTSLQMFVPPDPQANGEAGGDNDDAGNADGVNGDGEDHGGGVDGDGGNGDAGNNGGGGNGGNAVIRWLYEGEHHEFHGEQAAPIGATVTDDVFGNAFLRGQQPGKLLITTDDGDRVRTEGHIFYNGGEGGEGEGRRWRGRGRGQLN